MSIQPTIVVATYNRPHALKGLLASLARAEYPTEVRLLISIDGGGDEEVIAIAEAYEWPGEKLLLKHPPLGLKAHLLYCGGLTQQFGSIIMLEDDIEVAPGFYQYAQEALETYGQDELISGISLYGYQVAENNYGPFAPFDDGLDAYLIQFPSSWGQAFTAAQWLRFQNWLQHHPIADNNQLPAYVQRWGAQSWKKHFVQYLLQEARYFVFPKVSFTTNKGYSGTHFALQLSLFEVPTHAGAMVKLPAVELMARYNAYFNMEEATAQRLGLPKPINPPQNADNIAHAEYHFRVAKGLLKPSLLGKWWFVAKYNWHNYLNALRRKL